MPVVTGRRDGVWSRPEGARKHLDRVVLVSEVLIDRFPDEFSHGDALGHGGTVDPLALLLREVDLSSRG